MGEQPEKEAIFLVYVGSRIGAKDKLIDHWLHVAEYQLAEGILPAGADDETTDCYRVYSRKGLKYMKAVGTAYKVPQVKGTTSIFSGEARFAGLWPNDEQRFTWQATHRTHIADLELRKRAKKRGWKTFRSTPPVA